jgi:hypothetical protein
MIIQSRSVIRSAKPRGVRVVLAGLGVLVMAVLAGWSLVGIVPMFQQGHPWLATFLAIVMMVLLSVSISVFVLYWRASDASGERPVVPADSAGDQTGIWGVGGPSMREPGSTGVWPARRVDRRYEDRDD